MICKLAALSAVDKACLQRVLAIADVASPRPPLKTSLGAQQTAPKALPKEASGQCRGAGIRRYWLCYGGMVNSHFQPRQGSLGSIGEVRHCCAN